LEAKRKRDQEKLAEKERKEKERLEKKEEEKKYILRFRPQLNFLVHHSWLIEMLQLENLSTNMNHIG